MKLGCQSLSFKDRFAAGDLTLEGFIDWAADAGLDAIDIHGGNLKSTEPDYLRLLKERGKRRRIAFSYIGISNDFSIRGTELSSEIENTKRFIDAAAALGVGLVRVFASKSVLGEDAEPVWSQDITCMKEVCRYARSRGVDVGLQNHNHYRITRTGEDVVRMLQAVKESNFTHILDTGQYLGSPGASGSDGKPDEDYDAYDSIEKTAPYAAHVRAKIYRIHSGVEEWLDYPRIFEILRRVGYDGCVSIVYEGQAFEPEADAVPKAIRYLRDLIGNHERTQ